MALAQLFRSEAKTLLDRIQNRQWSSPEEKAQLLEDLAGSKDVKVADAIKFLFVPDADLRKAATRLLAARRDPEMVAHFLSSLGGRPEAARRAGLAALASLSLKDLADKLGEILEKGEPADRAMAGEALLDLPIGNETLPLLIRAIQRGEAALRYKAVSRLAAVATDRHISFFEGLLTDPDERIRLAAYQVIIRFASIDKLPLLLNRLPDEPYSTQQVLIAGIQQLAPRAGPELLDQALALLSSGNTGLRNAAIKILLSLPDRPATIRRFVEYSRTLMGWVRDRALASMREFGSEVVGPALELLVDVDPEVRSTALAILSSFDDPRVTEASLQLLADEDWWLAINAADLLGRQGYAPAVNALIEALGRDDVRWAAVEALGRIGGPDAVDALLRLVEDERPEIRVEALAALAHAGAEDQRVFKALVKVAEHDPAKWARARAQELLRQAMNRRKEGTGDQLLTPGMLHGVALEEGAPPVHHLLAQARRMGASDLHIAVDCPAIVRINGMMVKVDEVCHAAAAVEKLIQPLLSLDQKERLDQDHQLDACFYVENDGRYRGSLFLDRHGLNGVFRVIPEQPPTISDIGLPPDIAEVATFHQGIILVTGPSGSGKSTTLAALVNLVNDTRRSHILTMEDPVEFVHPFKSSLINQRDVGKHTRSYARALRAALREDPDVIVIGELRDHETVSLALTAAETGHLVITTLNATTAAKAVDRVISSFPADEQPQVRESFAGSIKLVIAQALVGGSPDMGRVPCFEILKATLAVVNAIKDSKTYQLPSLMQIGANAGMRTFDDALMHLVRESRITPEIAYTKATSKETFAPLVSPKFLEELFS